MPLIIGCCLFLVIKYYKQNIVVLLTMTIDINNTVDTKRHDINDRISDYRKSLARWAALPYAVIVLENSGYGNPFKDILHNAKNIHYISIKLPQDQMKGKSYGEAQILKYAMDKIIKNNNIYIVKMTGRYAPVADLTEVLQHLQLEKPDVILSHGVGSEWFVAKRKFFLELATQCIKTCKFVPGKDEYYFAIEGHLQRLSNTKKMLKYHKWLDVIPTYRGTTNQKVDQI